MSDRDERAADERAEAFGHAGSVWSAHDLKGGMTGVSVLAFAFGVVALVLAVVDRFPLLTFLLAALGFLLGLRLFMPRLTTLDKVLLPLGMLTSAAAVVVQLLRIAQ
jgi:hypothetical protein